MTKLGESPGRKTVLKPPKSEMERMGVSLAFEESSAVSFVESSRLVARRGLCSLWKCSEDERDVVDVVESLVKGSYIVRSSLDARS
jgi:hypothetical protein